MSCFRGANKSIDDLRQAMQRNQLKSLPLYPEDRACKQPTTRTLLDLFEGMQRHELTATGQDVEVLVTELSPLQRHILKLPGIPAGTYGRPS